MDIITVIIQAVVQGLTEFLPVSSSGHLSVVQHVTGVNGEAALVLSLVLHLGTLAAVFVAFWGTIWGKGIFPYYRRHLHGEILMEEHERKPPHDVHGDYCDGDSGSVLPG